MCTDNSNNIYTEYAYSKFKARHCQDIFRVLTLIVVTLRGWHELKSTILNCV